MKVVGTLCGVYKSDCLGTAHLCVLPAFALFGASLAFSGARFCASSPVLAHRWGNLAIVSCSPKEVSDGLSPLGTFSWQEF